MASAATRRCLCYGLVAAVLLAPMIAARSIRRSAASRAGGRRGGDGAIPPSARRIQSRPAGLCRRGERLLGLDLAKNANRAMPSVPAASRLRSTIMCSISRRSIPGRRNRAIHCSRRRRRIRSMCRSSPIFSPPHNRNSNSARDCRRMTVSSNAPMPKWPLAAGLTKDQVVRIYSFEATGNGNYDVEAGLEFNKHGRAITTALGYNQLLATNSVEIVAETRRSIRRASCARAAAQMPAARQALDGKIEILRRMIAFTRSVPDAWGQHEMLANTSKGLGVHALNLDVDIGPLLQTQKLLNSVVFARRKGFDHTAHRRRTGNDESHRRRQRFRHGDDAVAVARQGADGEFLPAQRLWRQSGRAA